MKVAISKILLHFYLLVIFCNLTLGCLAVSSINTTDTTKPTASLPTYSELLNKYGTNDTSRGLIRLFELKRKGGKHETLIYGVIAVVSVATILSNTKEGGIDLDPWVAILLLVTAAISVVGLLVGAYNWAFFRKRHLLHLLEEYNNGKPIPTRFTKDRTFKKYLKSNIKN